MKISGMSILVTGGAGFIGSHLVDELMREGCYVKVLDDLTNGKYENLIQHDKNKKFQFIQGSVINSSDVARSVDGVDIIFHLATLGVRHSIKYPFMNHRVNAEGTLLVLEEAYKRGIKKFVYCSSSEVYGTAEYVPMAENHPTYPCTVYGASKLAGEAYARAYYKTYGFNTIIVRPFNTYGPRSHYEGDAGEMIPKSIVRALNGKPILVFGDGKQTRDFTYVNDIARGLLSVVSRDLPSGITLNIGSNYEVSIKKIAEMILKKCENPLASIEQVKNRPGDVLRLYADAAGINKVTGWKPLVSLEEGLTRTIQWFKSRPEGVSALINQEIGFNWE